MRILSLFLIFFFFLHTTYSQEDQSPTLSVGLESLTLAKGTIDIDALRKVVIRKQKELKREGLKRFVFNKLPENNYTTKLFFQNSILTLLDEKNQDIVEKELLELATNYGVVIGFSELLYANYVIHDSFIAPRNKIFKENSIATKNIDSLINNSQTTDKNVLIKKNNNYKKIKDSIVNKKISNRIQWNIDDVFKEPITETLKKQFFMDVVGTQLSANKTLKSKGFFDFDSRIDYKKSTLYKSLLKKIDSTELEKSKLQIDSAINGYLASYQFIKEVIVGRDYKKLENLKEFFIQEAYKSLGQTLIDSIGKKAKLERFTNLYNRTSEIGEIDKLIKEYAKARNELRINIAKFEGTKSYFRFNKDSIHAILKSNNTAHTYSQIQTIFSDNNTDTILKNNLELLIKRRLEILRNRKEQNKSLNENSTKLVERIKNLNKKIKEFKNSLEGDAIASSVSIARIKTLISQMERKIAIIMGNTIKAINDSEAKQIFQLFDNAPYTNFQKSEQLNDSFNEAFLEYKNYEKILESNENIIESYKNLETNFFKYIDIKRKDFFKEKGFLNTIFLDLTDQLLKQNLGIKDPILIKTYSDFFSDLYIRTRTIVSKDRFTIDDVVYFEKIVIPNLIKAKLLTSNIDTKEIEEIIKKTNATIAIMKFFVMPNIDGLVINEDIVSFLNFLSRIDELEKADTFAYILQVLDETHSFFEETLDFECANDTKKEVAQYCEFKKVYEKLLNNIEKYTLITNNDKVIEIDLVSFLDSFIKSYENSSGQRKASLYFTMGISENIFLKELPIDGNPSKSLKTIGFASEKIGFKLRLHSFKNYFKYNYAQSPINSHEISSKQNPFVNEVYFLAYGSGLLYRVANLTTEESFDYPYVGTGIGFRFFNTLDFNISMGFPFIDDQDFGKNPFIGVSFDIPIVEYLRALQGD